MSENDIQPGDELEQDPQDSEESSEESTDAEQYKARIAELEKEKQTLLIKRQKDKEKLEKLRTNSSTSTEDDVPPPSQELSEKVSKLELAEQKRQFGYAHSLSPEEVDQIFKINPSPTKESLDDPFIKGGLEAIRAKNRVANATPSSKGRTPTIQGKTFSEMSEDEKRKNYQEVIASSLQ